MHNDENRPQIETEVVDQVARLCCCAAPLSWRTMTKTRSGKTIEQRQETRERHTPDLARGLEASLVASALPSQGAPYSSVGPQLTSSNLNLSRVSPVLACSEDTRSLALHQAAHTATPPRRCRCPCGIRVPVW